MKKDAIHVMSWAAIGVCLIKFLFQGGPVTWFGTADSMTYAAILTPVLGAHFARQQWNGGNVADRHATVDNPDGA